MATSTVALSGRWSQTATWVGASLPAAGDWIDLSSSKATTYDYDGTFDTIVGATSSTMVVLGTRTLTLINGGTLGTTGSNFTVPVGTQNLTINGSVQSGQLPASTHFVTVAGGTLVVNGNSIGGGGASASSIRLTSGTVTINGNCTGGTGNGATYGLMVSTTGNGIVNGNAIGGSGATAAGVYCDANIAGSLRVTGTAIGGSGSAAYGIQIAGTPCTFIGSITDNRASGLVKNSTNTFVYAPRASDTATIGGATLYPIKPGCGRGLMSGGKL